MSDADSTASSPTGVASLALQLAAQLRLLARIVRFEHALIPRVPLIGEIQAALLHPSIEVALGNFVGRMK